MKYFLFLTLFLTVRSHAWTLIDANHSSYSSSDVTVRIGSNTCSNAGLTPSSLDSLVQDAIAEFWNKVPTSALKLESSGNSGITITIADTLTTLANKTTTNTILVGCNQNASIFTSANILAVGGIACSGTDCRGAVLMNDVAGSNLSLSDRATVVTALAHEMGHALGLGHTSVQGALMYYDLTGKSQTGLAQDDIDGISYLYPNKKAIGGLAGACGTIDDQDKNSGIKFVSNLFLGIFLMAFIRKFLFVNFQNKEV